MDVAQKDRRRSSSVHTLLQIRRDSAKISEELANLTAQLTAAMNTRGSTSQRPSLSVPGTSTMTDDGTPTINQLIAENDLNKSLPISSSYLTVNSKGNSTMNVLQTRGRS